MEILLSVLIVIASVGLLSVGVLAGRSPIEGSCASAQLDVKRTCPLCSAQQSAIAEPQSEYRNGPEQ